MSLYLSGTRGADPSARSRLRVRHHTRLLFQWGEPFRWVVSDAMAIERSLQALRFCDKRLLICRALTRSRPGFTGPEFTFMHEAGGSDLLPPHPRNSGEHKGTVASGNYQCGTILGRPRSGPDQPLYSRGLKTSRRKSPIRLMAMTMTTRKKPGISVIHQEPE